MYSNEFKNIIENARIAKGNSQRELAKLSGISINTLNDIINGKIKKVRIRFIRFWCSKKKKGKKARQHLFYTIEHLKIMQESKDSLYTIDKAIEDIKWCFDELEDVEHKYDYDKLPKDM